MKMMILAGKIGKSKIAAASGDANATGAHYDLTYLRAGTEQVYTSWIPIGDIPVEMLVYVQTSPDVPMVVQELERIGFQTGQGKELKVLVD